MTFDPSLETPPADGLPLSESALPDLGLEGLPDQAEESFGGESPLADPPAFTDPPAADSTGAVPPSPADAALANAWNGRWMMNEGFDGWVLLGADGKPVMRSDRSRVGFRFADAARLAQQLAAAPDEESGEERSGRTALAPLESGFNQDWDPQVPHSRLADRTKLVKLLAYHYVQTTEPEEAVRRAVSDIFGNPTYLDEPGIKAWVPAKYDVNAVKSIADTLLRRISGPGTAPVSKKGTAHDPQQPPPVEEVPEDIKNMDRLSFHDALKRYAKGNGQAIRIPLSSLDFSNVSASQLFGDKKKNSYTFPGEDGRTIGTLSLILVAPDTVRAESAYDTYNFDIKFKDPVRDAKTALGYLVNEGYALGANARVERGPAGGPLPVTRGGTPYRIYLEGEAKIKP